MKKQFPRNPSPAPILAATLLSLCVSAWGVTPVAPLGDNSHCAPVSARNAGQINMGGQTCAASLGRYVQWFTSGSWAGQCTGGYTLTGLHNIQCRDEVDATGHPHAVYSASGCCSLPSQTHDHAHQPPHMPPSGAIGGPGLQAPPQAAAISLPQPVKSPLTPIVGAPLVAQNTLSTGSSLAAAASVNTMPAVSVPATPPSLGYSWNLSRAIANSAGDGHFANPFGEDKGTSSPLNNVWHALYDNAGLSLNPANYVPLPQAAPTHAGTPYPNWNYHPTNHSLTVGTTTASINLGPYRYVRGLPSMHPAPGKAAVIAWRSPIDGQVAVLGRIADVNYQCGDGVHWYVQSGSTVLQHGVLQSAGGVYQSARIQFSSSVHPGSTFYFVVAPQGNHQCDTTSLDLLITTN